MIYVTEPSQKEAVIYALRGVESFEVYTHKEYTAMLKELVKAWGYTVTVSSMNSGWDHLSLYPSQVRQDHHYQHSPKNPYQLYDNYLKINKYSSLTNTNQYYYYANTTTTSSNAIIINSVS